MATFETKENAKDEALQTHYFKASYDQIKEAYIEIIKKLHHEILSVNDDYGEIFSEVPHFSVTAKVIMQTPKETSIDFYISSEYLFANGSKVKKFLNNVYQTISKTYELKGVGLHK